MGFSLLSSLRIFNAPMDPVLNNTGYWIQVRTKVFRYRFRVANPALTTKNN